MTRRAARPLDANGGSKDRTSRRSTFSPFGAGRGLPLLLGAFGVAPASVGMDSEIRSFFEASPTPQLLLTSERTVRAANPSASRLLGARGASLSGRPFTDLLVPAARPVAERLFQSLKAPDSAGQRVALDAVSPDGRPFPVELVVVRLSTAAVSGFGVLLRDLRLPPPGRTPAPVEARETYTLAELLMANRLRELV